MYESGSLPESLLLLTYAMSEPPSELQTSRGGTAARDIQYSCYVAVL